MELLHRRFGHTNIADLKALIRHEAVTGLRNLTQNSSIVIRVRFVRPRNNLEIQQRVPLDRFLLL